MIEKKIVKERITGEAEERTIGMGHIFKAILDEKGISIQQFSRDLAFSRFHYDISCDMLYKIFQDKVNMRTSQVGVFMEVAQVEPTDFANRLIAHSVRMQESGDLYNKKPYYPKKGEIYNDEDGDTEYVGDKTSGSSAENVNPTEKADIYS